MKLDGLKVVESEFNGKKFHQLVAIIDGKVFLIGTVRENVFNGTEIRYINCIHKEKKDN